MKAILIIDADNIDIKNTQATYIELQCNNQTRQMSLVNHWLKPMPQKKGKYGEPHQYDTDIHYEIGWNDCVRELEK